jgi:hypothetical protein
MEFRETLVAGDRVAFSFHFDATGRNGVRTGRDQASLATLRNGLLFRIENYASWDEAVEALERAPIDPGRAQPASELDLPR